MHHILAVRCARASHSSEIDEEVEVPSSHEMYMPMHLNPPTGLVWKVYKSASSANNSNL